ncbi:MAG: PD-(D/E)XK nuclease family protein [Akkermansiaceae bacterium]|nr:PD-(D/E)XK nuclease family protein [Akkermansiaceae bacterium]
MSPADLLTAPNRKPFPISLTPAAAEVTSVVSASRLKCYQTCRRQFYFRYMLGLKKPAGPALIVGQALHRMLEIWNHARWHGDNAINATTPERFEEEWQKIVEAQPVAWKDNKDEEKQKTTALRLWQAWQKNPRIPLDEAPEGVEVYLEHEEATSDQPKIIGYLDLVRAGGLLVEFKTAARSTKAEELAHQHRLQLTIYALLYRESTWQQERGFQVIQLIKTKEPKIEVFNLPPATDRDFEELDATIRAFQEGVAHGDFSQSPGQHCSWCDYRTECMGKVATN